MKKWKAEYDKIEVPEEMRDRIEDAVQKAYRQKSRTGRIRVVRGAAAAAAAFAVLLVIPNTSQAAAAAMQSLPVVGDFFKVVTIREYQVDEERYTADVKVPEVLPEEAAYGNDEEAAGQAKQTAEEINFDIQAATDELIEEFKATMEEYEEGHQDLYIGSEVLTDDNQWFSLDLVLYQGAGSGYERHRHYTIDKTTGKRAQLSDFYGEDYIGRISEEVKAQMRRQMEEDENVVYWLDNEEMQEWNFESIGEDQDFYVNEDGKVVICFDEYEVAPGYMGYVEFVLE